MKNIHLIPTDKPSRLSILNSGKLNFGAEFISSSNSKAQNIYITSDEEIKEGDWVYCRIENRVLVSNVSYSKLDNRFKIILTTDQELIEVGVQAIDDEFLEWFVKNSSCEEVEVQYQTTGLKNGVWQYYYKIIIPKEEPKQDRTCTHNCSVVCGECQIFEPKQETLEEAAERLAYDSTEENKGFPKIKAFKDGAKFQAERMYSGEEVLAFGKSCFYKGFEKAEMDDANCYTAFREEIGFLFEQFKKKISK